MRLACLYESRLPLSSRGVHNKLASYAGPLRVQYASVGEKSVPPANGVARGFACESDRSGV